MSSEGFLFLSSSSVCFDCPQSGSYPSLRGSLLASSALGRGSHSILEQLLPSHNGKRGLGFKVWQVH